LTVVPAEPQESERRSADGRDGGPPRGAARLEDPALVRGAARFVADLPAPGALRAQFVRSSLAHGRIRSVELSAAFEAPGVVAAYTAADLGLGPFQHLASLPAAFARSPLAAGSVRHVGEAVAVVLAESDAEAADAVEAVDVDIEPLPALVDPVAAARPDALLLYPEAGTNVVAETTDDGPDPTDGAALVVELDIVNPRLASAPLECDGILVTPTPEGGLDVWCTSQGVHGIRDELARALGLDAAAIRVRSPAVGGGFGGRGTAPVEFVVVAAAALRLGRAVRWIQSRYENLTTMPQGRGYHSRVRLGVGGDGRIVGLDLDVVADCGGTAHMAPLLLAQAQREAVGLYRVPRYRFRARAAVTTTAPVGAYRGAGQPEGVHAMERALDVVARRLGIDPVEVRRRNLLPADAFPLTTVAGAHIDVADPVRALETALELAEVSRWRAEQAERRRVGATHQLGIGIACYSQTTGRGRPADPVSVRVDEQGRVTVSCGSASHGQGHRTTWAELVSERLGVEPALVEVVDADTAAIDGGMTTGGSRTTQALVTSLVGACTDLVAAARERAAALLEAAPDDLVVQPSGFGQGAGLAVAGVPTRRVTWAELAAGDGAGTAAAGDQELRAWRCDAVGGSAHPYGTHVTVVEVDVETGAVRLVAHTAVDDCGTVLQPAIVEGQQHGGSAAGLGQALWEHIAYDAAGNPLTASLGSYLLPSAAELCPINTATVALATERNAVGAKGIGENGAIAATPSAHNAVLDALAPFGVEHVDLPLTPERVATSVAAAGHAGPGGSRD
jgi:aerobic carbon-monoxide dehydrogenase large subunit